MSLSGVTVLCQVSLSGVSVRCQVSLSGVSVRCRVSLSGVECRCRMSLSGDTVGVQWLMTLLSVFVPRVPSDRQEQDQSRQRITWSQLEVGCSRGRHFEVASVRSQVEVGSGSSPIEVGSVSMNIEVGYVRSLIKVGTAGQCCCPAL